MRTIVALTLLSLAGCGPAPLAVEHLFDWRPNLHVQDGPLGVRLERFACLPRVPGFMQELTGTASAGPGVAFVLELEIRVAGKPPNSGGLVESGGPYSIWINGMRPVPVGGSGYGETLIDDEGTDGRVTIVERFYEAPSVGETLDVEVSMNLSGGDSRSIRFVDLAVPVAARVTR